MSSEGYFNDPRWMEYLACKYTYEIVSARYPDNEMLIMLAEHSYGEACSVNCEFISRLHHNKYKEDDEEAGKYWQEFRFVYPYFPEGHSRSITATKEVIQQYANEFMGEKMTSYELCLERYDLYRKVRRHVYDKHTDNGQLINYTNYKLGDAITDICSELSGVVLGKGKYSPVAFLGTLKNRIELHKDTISWCNRLSSESRRYWDEDCLSEYLTKIKEISNEQTSKIHPLLMEYLEEYAKVNVEPKYYEREVVKSFYRIVKEYLPNY